RAGPDRLHRADASSPELLVLLPGSTGLLPLCERVPDGLAPGRSAAVPTSTGADVPAAGRRTAPAGAGANSEVALAHGFRKDWTAPGRTVRRAGPRRTPAVARRSPRLSKDRQCPPSDSAADPPGGGTGFVPRHLSGPPRRRLPAKAEREWPLRSTSRTARPSRRAWLPSVDSSGPGS